MESLAQSVSRLQGVTCVFESHGPRAKHDERVALHLYRIAQEAVNNAIRHGKARKIVICLGAADQAVNLRVSDDGTGISQSTYKNGMGLDIMRYRARLTGGELCVRPREDGGTMVSYSLGLVPNESATV